MRDWSSDVCSSDLERRSAVTGLIVNSLGASMTVLVLLIVTITKFTHGAWLVFLAIPVLSVLMLGVNRYYRDVEHEIRMDDSVNFGSDGDVAAIRQAARAGGKEWVRQCGSGG